MAAYTMRSQHFFSPGFLCFQFSCSIMSLFSLHSCLLTEKKARPGSVVTLTPLSEPDEGNCSRPGGPSPPDPSTTPIEPTRPLLHSPSDRPRSTGQPSELQPTHDGRHWRGQWVNIAKGAT